MKEIPHALPRDGRRNLTEAIGLAIIAAVIVWAYAYLSTSRLGLLFRIPGPDSQEYYHYLTEGFVHGHLAMNVDPPPALAALPNPYDLAARTRIGELGLHDVSYYKGRYYLYFGPAPALVLFLPFRLLTGHHFPSDLAAVLFCAGGYLSSLGLFLGFRRRYFPDCGTGIVWLAAVMFGLGNFCLVMLMRNSVWELPISSAYCFSCLGYWLLFNAFEATTRRAPRLALAGAAFGLAVASRPHFVFCGAVVCALWIWDWRSRPRGAGERDRGLFLRETTALFLPLGLAVAGLLLYNTLRFDNPLEFGQKYMLAGIDQSHLRMLGPRFVPINFYYEFLAPAQFQRYFPFVDVVRSYPGIRPEGYFGFEDPYGLLSNMPISWLAMGVPVIWGIRFRDNRTLGSWIRLFGLCFAALSLAVLCFPGAANRYMVDFIPTLEFVAGLGLLMIGSLRGGSAGWRKLLQSAGVAIVAYTALFNVFAAFAHNGMFEAHRSRAYHALQDWFDRPVFLWEKWRSEPYGPLEMTVRLAQGKPGRVEPLLVTGVSYRSDYTYIYYDPDGLNIRLGYTRTNHEQQLSQPIPVDFNVPHRIGIESGALYPRKGHPYFAGWAPARVEAAKRTLQVSFDGVPYLEGTHEFFETTPGFLSIGRNGLSAYTAPRFSGAVLSARRGSLAPSTLPLSENKFFRAAFVLPQGASGRREPLISTGSFGAGDLIFIAYDDDTHIRLGFHHSGSAPIWGEPLSVAPGQVQILDGSMGSFFSHPRNAEERQMGGVLFIRFNGRVVWAEPRSFHPAGNPVASFGVNSWRSDACAASFSGRILAVQPTDSVMPDAPSKHFIFAPYWLEAGGKAGYGPLRLNVVLPRNRAGKFEPLLVSGPSVSQADYLWIRYQEDGASVIIGYEHTSGGGPNSGAFPLDPARPHVIEMELPSLYPPQGDAYFGGLSLLSMVSKKGRVRISVDGVVRIDAPAKAYESTPEQATPGENRLSDTFGRKFSGRVARVERATHALPAGFLERAGPIELDLVWPDTIPVGKSEVLLASGDETGRDSLLVSYQDLDHVRFLFRDHLGATRSSPLLQAGPARQTVLRIGWGGFYPDSTRSGGVPADEWARRQRAYSVQQDGTPILSGEAGFFMGDPQSLSLGQAADGGDPFSGSIRSVGRLPAQ